MTETLDSWPAGALWVFQGTVAEDATGGTHVCTLTVVPGVGNEFEVLYGQIIVGNTATAQTVAALITDGTNNLTTFLNPAGSTITTANLTEPFPQNAAFSGATPVQASGASLAFIVSGTMQLVLRVTTAAISVTQTFSVVCRIKGAMPTATLADSVGTPVLTVNTNKVF